MDQPGSDLLRDCYNFFLLPYGAPIAAVKEVHRAYLKAWHPDRHLNENPAFRNIANRVMQRANEALRAIECAEAETGPMIRCESCGSFTPEGSHICSACGRPFLTSCPRCEKRWPALFRYCGDCGARL